MRTLLLPMLGLMLTACIASESLAADKPRVKKASAQKKVYRFEMVQNGKRMTADDFDRWMKANGIRVAKGPRAVKPKKKRR